jgi:glycosyltransferase involved in cell wall biosynthesis
MSFPDNPKFSIIVPSYNQGKYIKETIDSILRQDYRPIEILVMDGGSSDETVEILKNFGNIPELSWVSEQDNGVVDAVNKGLKAISGDIVGIQSSDDCYVPGTFSTVARYFQDSQKTNILYGNVEYIDKNSNLIGRSHVADYRLNSFLSRKSSIFQSSAFFRGSILRDLPGWNQRYSYVADNEFWLRICIAGGVIKIDRVLSRYRYHPEQRDVEKKRIKNDWASMIAESKAVMDLPFSSRMAARSGVYRTKLSCTKENNWLRRSWYSYLAVLLYPPIYSELDKRDLKIGYRPVRSVLSRIKQKLVPIVTKKTLL